MSHLAIAPLLLPLLVGILLLFMRHLDIRVRRTVSVAAVFGQIGLALLLAGALSSGDILVYKLGNWAAPFGIVLVADALAAWMLLVTALLALFALLYACQGGDTQGRHFHVLFQLQLFGLNGAFLTGDLFNLFVFFEVLLLASYGLILHGGGRARVRAGLHYVVLNLAGSALFLIAVGTLYGVFGTLNMADLAVKVAATPAQEQGLARAAGLLLFTVFALKAALLPLYLWLPAAYANTSAPVAALFAIMTKVGVYSIIRVYSLVFGAEAGPLAHLIAPWLLPLALATLLVGMLGVLAATGLRQQATYLVVASVGSLLTAFALDSGAGIAASLYYLPHSTFAAAALFLLADVIASQRGKHADSFEPGPAMARAVLLGGLFFVTAIQVVGLPPLSGFLGKFLLLRAALEHPAAAGVMAVVLLGGLLGMIALARSGSLLFFRSMPLAEGESPPPAAPIAVALIPVVGLLLLGLAMTVFAGPLQVHVTNIAEQLSRPYLYVHAVLGGRI
ncbi:MAG: monovalent cation/H+ antiporter subunit D [Pseudomonadota bacterium]|nr:monovalent cation/H+ antiporter subunit D [Pseudomonadota bacterium]